MFGLFGKKDTKPPPAPQPTAQQGGPAAEPAGGGDMFGGMMTTGRRRRGQTTAAAPAGSTGNLDEAASMHSGEGSEAAGNHLQSHSASPPQNAQGSNDTPNKDDAAGGEKPTFFAKFDLTKMGGPSDFAEELQESPERQRVRQRLERFYQKYNPQKLVLIDQTLTRFEGREDDLFDALIQKYGPEPEDPSKLTAATGQQQSKSNVPAPSNDKKETAEATGFTAPPASGGDDAWGAPGAGFGDAFTVEPGAGGFTFGTEGTSNTGAGGTTGGFGFTDDTGNEGGGFNFAGDGDTAATNAGGFGFGDATDTSGGGGFDFGNSDQPAFFTDVSPVKKDEADDVKHVSKPQSQTTSDDDNDDGGRYGAVEQCAKNISKAKQAVETLRGTLAQKMSSFSSTVLRRRQLVDKYMKLERDLEALTQQEDYEGAEDVDNQMVGVGNDIDECDEQLEELHGAIIPLRAEIEVNLQNVSSVYISERSVLLETKAEEERRVTNYLAESRHRIEKTNERLSAELQKATRAEKNAQHEVKEAEVRREKIERDIAEQTKGLRAEKTKVSEQAAKLEKEIAELEKTLATKRRALVERKATMGDLESQLQVIEGDHAEAMADVKRQIAEESTRLANFTERVRGLTEETERNKRDEEELQQETEVMQKGLKEHSAKIDRYEHCASVVQKEVNQKFVEFFSSAIENVLKARKSGGDGLTPKPHEQATAVANSSDSGKSRLAMLQAEVASIATSKREAVDETEALQAKIQELVKSLGVLEAAKKAAATKKAFREAQQKTEEIKKATQDKVEAEEMIEKLKKKVEQLDERLVVVERERQTEAKAHRERIRAFTEQYQGILAEAWDRAASASVDTTAGVSLVLDEYENPEAEPDLEKRKEDVLIKAAIDLVRSFYSELAALCDVPVETLMRSASEQGNEVSNEAELADDPTAPVEESSATPRKESSPTSDHEREEEKEEPGAEASPQEEEEDPFAKHSIEELEVQLEQLDAQVTAAAEAEEYEKAEELQSQIGLIEAALAAKRNA